MKLKKIEKTAARFPRWIKKPMQAGRLCCGTLAGRRDVGVARLRGGELVAFAWGDNYTLEELKTMRKAGELAGGAVYLGEVWDGGEGAPARDNFARVLPY